MVIRNLHIHLVMNRFLWINRNCCADMPLFSEKTDNSTIYIFSKNGFTPSLLKSAARGGVILITLEALYR